MIHNWWRFLIHIPIGIAAYRLVKESGWLGFIFIILFVVYEENEDTHINDFAYPDYQGAMGGILFMLILNEIKRRRNDACNSQV